MKPPTGMLDFLLMLVSLPAAKSLVQLLFSYRKTGALCAMKEVALIPDDPRSAECVRQLQQVISRICCTTSSLYNYLCCVRNPWVELTLENRLARGGYTRVYKYIIKLRLNSFGTLGS